MAEPIRRGSVDRRKKDFDDLGFCNGRRRHAAAIPVPAFLGDEPLIRNAAVLDGIPGVMIHGRHDVSSPLETAWQLSQRWRRSELIVLDDAGHGGGASFTGAIIAALNRLAAR